MADFNLVQSYWLSYPAPCFLASGAYKIFQIPWQRWHRQLLLTGSGNWKRRQLIIKRRPNWPRWVRKLFRVPRGQGEGLQGPRGSRERPTGSQGVKGKAYRVPRGQGGGVRWLVATFDVAHSWAIFLFLSSWATNYLEDVTDELIRNSQQQKKWFLNLKVMSQKLII